jgi:hypothetical protein
VGELDVDGLDVDADVDIDVDVNELDVDRLGVDVDVDVDELDMDVDEFDVDVDGLDVDEVRKLKAQDILSIDELEVCCTRAMSIAIVDAVVATGNTLTVSLILRGFLVEIKCINCSWLVTIG